MNTQFVYSTLSTLGEIKPDDNWLNYASLGIKPSHVDQLITLIEQADDGDPDVEKPDTWTGLHAMRAIAQLKSLEATQKILDLSLKKQNAFWFDEELHNVIAELGTPHLPWMLKNLSNEALDPLFRGGFAEAISTISKRDKSCHDTLKSELIQFLDNNVSSSRFLNAFVINILVEINATDAIESIRKAFEVGKVDITFNGDLEDLEIELGIRDKRSTPKPNYNKIGSDVWIDPSTIDFDNPIEVVDYFFQKYGNDNSILSASELDGFLAAIACSNKLIAPSHWLPEIWGNEEDSPCWESDAEFMQFFNAVMQLYNGNLDELQSGRYTALFLEPIMEPQNAIVEEWCYGFKRGMLLWEELSEHKMEKIRSLMIPIMLFSSDSSDTYSKLLSSDNIEDYKNLIEPNVVKIYRLLHQSTMVRSETKIGRNDPCPCGSGKKFKKCCLH
jgi:uncharacterized protein